MYPMKDVGRAERRQRQRQKEGAIAAALSEIHARGLLLQHSVVRSPPPPMKAEKPAPVVQSSAVSKPPSTTIVWLQRPLRRWKRKLQAEEPMGLLEFLPSASLGQLRTLVQDFYLPKHRDFVFLHPMDRVELPDTCTVDVSWPCLLIQMCPKPKPVEVSEKRPVNRMSDRRMHDTVVQPAIVNGVRCNVTIQRCQDKVAVQVQVCDGAHQGKTSAVRWFPADQVLPLLHEDDASQDHQYDGLVEALGIELAPSKSTSEELMLKTDSTLTAIGPPVRLPNVSFESALFPKPMKPRAVEPTRVQPAHFVKMASDTGVLELSAMPATDEEVEPPVVKVLTSEAIESSLVSNTVEQSAGPERQRRSLVAPTTKPAITKKQHQRSAAAVAMAETMEPPPASRTTRVTKKSVAPAPAPVDRRGRSREPEWERQSPPKVVAVKETIKTTVDDRRHDATKHTKSVVVDRTDGHPTLPSAPDAPIAPNVPNAPNAPIDPNAPKSPNAPIASNAPNASSGPSMVVSKSESTPAPAVPPPAAVVAASTTGLVTDKTLLLRPSTTNEGVQDLIRRYVAAVVSTTQLSFANYGLCYAELSSRETLLALEDELLVRCGNSQGKLQHQVRQFVLDEIASCSSSTPLSMNAIEHLDHVLNLAADLLCWLEPTRARLELLERDRSTFSALTNYNKRTTKRTLVLSNDERELISSFFTKDPTDDGWIEVLELLFLILQAPKGERPKTHPRSERLRTVVQKMLRLDGAGLRNGEYLVHKADEYEVWMMMRELLSQVPKKPLSALPETAAVLPIVQTLVETKRNQIAPSLAAFLRSQKTKSAEPHVRQTLQALSTVLKREYDEQLSLPEDYCLRFWVRVTTSRPEEAAHRRSVSRPLPRLSAKLSLITKRHCELMGQTKTDRQLDVRKARWNDREPMKLAHELQRNVFHGEETIALECVLVRKLQRPPSDWMADRDGLVWEKSEGMAVTEVSDALWTFWDESLAKDQRSYASVGINALFAERLLGASGLPSLASVVRTEGMSRCLLSFGYSLPSIGVEPPFARVVFRLHLPPEPAAAEDGMDQLVASLDQFFRQSSSTAQHQFLQCGGLEFLMTCLSEHRHQPKDALPFDTSAYPRERILRLLQAAIPSIVHVPSVLNRQTIHSLSWLAQLETSPLGEERTTGAVALQVLQAICSRQSEAEATTKARAFQPLNELQRKFLSEGGLEALCSMRAAFVVRAKAPSVSVDAIALGLLQSTECSSAAGLLVHTQHWDTFFVKKGVNDPLVLEFLLHQIHQSFFVKKFVASDRVVFCDCGCNGRRPESFESLTDVLTLFADLMVSSSGSLWAQVEMRGPLDLVHFVRSGASRVSETDQQQLLQALCRFQDQLTSRDALVRFASRVGPELVGLLPSLKSHDLRLSAFQAVSLNFQRCIDGVVWKSNLLVSFVESLYAMLQAICLHEAHRQEAQSLEFNRLVRRLLFPKDDDLQTNVSVAAPMVSLRREPQAPSLNGPTFFALLLDDHRQAGSHQSLLTSFTVLLHRQTLSENASLASHILAPMLVTLTWLLQSPELADVLVTASIDSILLDLMDAKLVTTQILATRAMTLLLFHTLRSPRSFTDTTIKRLCNSITIVLGTAAQSLTRLPATTGDDLVRSLCALGGTQCRRDVQYVLDRHAELLKLHRKDLTKATSVIAASFWDRHDWRDVKKTSGEQLLAFLRLLMVFGCWTNALEQINASSEVKSLLLLLWAFVRDREPEHMADEHACYYLVSLRNVVFALGTNLQAFDMTEFYDLQFLKNLLLYSQRPVTSLVQELATGALWALADANDGREAFATQFLTEISLDKSTTRTPTLSLLAGTIASKLSGFPVLEGIGGALAALVLNDKCAEFFLVRHGYLLVLGPIKVIAASSSSSGPVEATGCGTAFGPAGQYARFMTVRDRYVIQLCRFARNALSMLQKLWTAEATRAKPTILVKSSLPAGVEGEMVNTRTVLLPLLTHPNECVVQEVVQTVIVHLKAHPTRAHDLLESVHLDQIISLCWHSWSLLQAAAFECIRWTLRDVVNLQPDRSLHVRLVELRDRWVPCLGSPHFLVKKQVMIFAIDLLGRLEDRALVRPLAEMFTQPQYQQLLTDLFFSISHDFDREPDAGYVLQLLVRFVVQLDLIALTDNDQLVHAICVTLQRAKHKDDTFLRPLLCSCLCRIARQSIQNTEYFARKSRLSAILELFAHDLSVSELQHLALLLRTVASTHDGVRLFLGSHRAGCVRQIVRLLGAFFEITDSRDDEAEQKRLLALANDPPPIDEETPAAETERFILKAVYGKSVFVSKYTVQVYEELIRLLQTLVATPETTSERLGCCCKGPDGCLRCDPCDLIAKADGGRVLCRLLFGRLVLLRAGTDFNYVMRSTGTDAAVLGRETLQLLRTLSKNHQIRLGILQASPPPVNCMGGWWKVLLDALDQALRTFSSPDCDRAVDAVMILGYFCAEPACVLRLNDHEPSILFRDLMALLLAYLVTSDAQVVQSDVLLTRAVLFVMGRLAEYSDLLRQRSFQSDIARVFGLVTTDGFLSDPVALANTLVLYRNWTTGTTGMTGRLPSDTVLEMAAALLTRTDVSPSVQLVAADVLAHALLVPEQPPTADVEEDECPVAQRRMRELVRNWSGRRPVRHEADLMWLWKRPLSQIVTSHFGSEPPNLLLRLLQMHLVLLDPLRDQRRAWAIEELDSTADALRRCPAAQVEDQDQDCLQSVVQSVDLYASSAFDPSLAGSVRSWQLIQRLSTGSEAPELLQLVTRSAPLLIQSWISHRGTAFSTSIFERRRQVLTFLLMVLEDASSLLDQLESTDCIAIAEAFWLHAGSQSGTAFEWIWSCCQRRRLFWNALLTHFESAGPLQLLWNAASGLEPTGLMIGPPVSSLPFAIALLDGIVSRSPVAVSWLLSHRAFLFVFRWLFATDLHSAGAPLMALTARFLRQSPDLQQFLMADPRSLHRIMRRVFSPLAAVQLASIKLLQLLCHNTMMTERMLTMETFTGAGLAPVTPSMVGCVEQVLSFQSNQANQLRHNEITEVAHLVQVPLFLDLETSEVLELAACCIKSQVVEEDALLVLATTGRINSVPRWMMYWRPESQWPTRWDDLRQRVGLLPVADRFLQELKLQKPPQLYKITRDTFFRCTSDSTRIKIAKRITEIWMPVGARHSSFLPRRSLVHRLLRLATEDQAELTRLTVRKCPEGRRKSDVFALLQAAPLLTGLAPSSLAQLAVVVGEPTFLQVHQSLWDQQHALLLVCDDRPVEIFEKRMQRGSLIGFPAWVYRSGTRPSTLQVAAPDQREVLGVLISIETLRQTLSPTELELVLNRCYASTDERVDWIVSEPLSEISQRSELQLESLRLVRQLVHVDGYKTKIAHDRRLVVLLLQLAVSYYPTSVVSEVLGILQLVLDYGQLVAKYAVAEVVQWLHGSVQLEGTWSHQLLQILVADVDHWRRVPVKIVDQWLSLCTKLLVLCAPDDALDLPDEFWVALIAQMQQPMTCKSLFELIEWFLCNRFELFVDEVCTRHPSIPLAINEALVAASPCPLPLIQSFVLVCRHETIRCQVWSQPLQPQRLMRVLAQMAADLGCVATYPPIVTLYCQFLLLLCSSEVDERLDREISRLAEDRFGLLTLLLCQFEDLAVDRNIVLRVIGSMCVGVATNCVVAQQSRIGRQKQRFVEFIIHRTQSLPLDKSWVQEAQEMEALFLCAQALTHSSDGAQSFVSSGFMTIAVGLLHPLPPLPTQGHLSVWRALLLTLHNLVKFIPDQVLESALGLIGLFVAFFNQLSVWLQTDPFNARLSRVLREFARFLSFLVQHQRFRQRLYLEHFVQTDATKSFSFHLFEWILAPIDAGLDHQSIKLREELEVEALGLLTNLCLEAEIALVLGSEPRCVAVIRHIFKVLQTSSGPERMTAYLRFLCFLMEHWTATDGAQTAAAAFLSEFPVPVLVALCSADHQGRDTAKPFALRLLWLLERALMRPEWTGTVPSDGKLLVPLLAACASPFTTQNLTKTDHVGLRTIVNALGLASELVVHRHHPNWSDNWTDPAVNTVRSVLQHALRHLSQYPIRRASLTKHTESMKSEHQTYSAIFWPDYDDELALGEIEPGVDVGLTHQIVRLAVGLDESKIGPFAMWAASSEWHELVETSVFRGALCLISVRGVVMDFWTHVVSQALVLIRGILQSTRSIAIETKYLQTTRRMGLLVHIEALVRHLDTGLQTQAAKTGAVVVTSSIAAATDVERLRRVHNVPLVETVVKMLRPSTRLMTLELQLVEFLNSMMVHCPANVSAAMEAGFLSIDRTVGTALELEAAWLDAYRLVLRQYRTRPQLVRLVWATVVSLFLHAPLPDPVADRCLRTTSELLRVETAIQVLGTALDCRRFHQLLKMAYSSSSLEAASSYLVALAHAVVSSPSICRQMVQDPAVLSTLFEAPAEPSLYAARVGLLRDVVAVMSAEPALSAFLHQSYDRLVSLRLSERLLLLDLLPAVLPLFQTKPIRFEWWKEPKWKAVLETCHALLTRGAAAADDRVIGYRAMYALATSGFLTHFPDATLITRALVIQWTKELDQLFLFQALKTAGQGFQLVPFLSAKTTLKPSAPVRKRGARALISRRDPLMIAIGPDELVLLLINLVSIAKPSLVSTRRPVLVSLCYSLWLQQCYHDHVAGLPSSFDLLELLMQLIDKKAGSQIPEDEFTPLVWIFSRLSFSDRPQLERAFAQRLILSMTARPSTSTTITVHATDAMEKTQSALLNTFAFAGYDWTERICWDLQTQSGLVKWEDRGLLVTIWCDVLRCVCASRKWTDAVIRRQVLQLVLSELRYLPVRPDRVTKHLFRAFFGLVLVVFRWIHTDRMAYQSLVSRELQPLAKLCVASLVLIEPVGVVHRLTVDVLSRIAAFGDLALTHVHYAFGLISDPMDQRDRISKRISQTNALRAITDLLDVFADAKATVSLANCMAVVRQLCDSRAGLGPVLQCRRLTPLSLVDLLSIVLLSTTGTEIRAQVQLSRGPLMSSRSFLPTDYSPDHVRAAADALGTLHCCLQLHECFEPIAADVGLVRQLVATLACSDLSIAGQAAMALEEIIKTFQHARNDETKTESTLHDFERYYVHTGDSLYRRVAFFTSLRTYDVVQVVPATSLPSAFVLLAQWIQFFADQAPTLLVQATSAPKRSRPGQFLLSLLDVSLYALANYFSQIYDVLEPVTTEVRHHTVFCHALFALCRRTNDSPVVQDDLIRSKCLLLLHLLCSFDAFRYAVELFLDAQVMEQLLVIIEQTASLQEQLVAVRLLRDITSYGAVKDLFVVHSSLLKRVISWLEHPVLRDLQAFAASTIRNLATKSTDQTPRQQLLQQRKSIFVFAPSFQDQLSRSLFTGAAQQCEETVVFEYGGAQSLQLMVGIAPDRRSEALAYPVFVKVHIRLFDEEDVCVRDLQCKRKLSSPHVALTHALVLEEFIARAECDLVVRWSGRLDHPERSTVQYLVRHDSDGPVTTNHLISGDQLTVRFVHQTIRETAADLGPIGRVLKRDDVRAELLEDAVGIVAELCKNHSIFCDPAIRLWTHVLSVLASTGSLVCLESISFWFWRETSVSFFVQSMRPVLQLVQGMRRHNLLVPLESDLSPPLQQTIETTTSTRNFLTSLMEWLGAMETDVFTEHCINVLFVENADVLLFLCAQYYGPARMRARFFALVALVVRHNIVHCEAFARKHALRLLTTLLELKCEDEDQTAKIEMLQQAARVVVKMARSPRARRKFLTHGGPIYMGLIAQAVFTVTPIELGRIAAENLVLACSFLFEFLLATPTIPLDVPTLLVLEQLCATSRPDGLLEGLLLVEATSPEALERTLRHWQSPPLSILEMLLRFLSDMHRGDSFDRLAASILSAVMEKLPSRLALEWSVLSVLQKAHQTDFITGLSRCLLLTQWDFDSELTIVRRTYLASVCEGVRTGVIPPECRGVCQSFDHNFLLSETTVEDPVRAELARLVAFVSEHERLVKTLMENRKKSLADRIKTADCNARVMVGVHATLSVVLDFFTDVLAERRQEEGLLNDFDADRTVRLQRWLRLLEELGGLLCCGLQNLDREYYASLLERFHAQAVEFPAFFQKAEHQHSKELIVKLFFRNMDAILKRIVNKHELKGVTANDFLIADEANRILDRLHAHEADILNDLVRILGSKHAHERLARLMIGMHYVWKRYLDSLTISQLMAGTTKASEPLWTKIQRSLETMVWLVLHPLPFLRARWKQLERLLKRLSHLLDPSVLFGPATSSTTTSAHSPTSRVLPRSQRHPEQAEAMEPATVVDHPSGFGVALVHDSRVPFSSMESLLDHFGFASLGAKKTKQLLNLPTLKSAVLAELRQALKREPKTIEVLTVPQLEAIYQTTARDQLQVLFQHLRRLVKEADAGIELPLVEPQPLSISWWRFLLRPVQRARGFHLYYLVQQFSSSDATSQAAFVAQYQSLVAAQVNERQQETSTDARPVLFMRQQTKSVHRIRPQAVALKRLVTWTKESFHRRRWIFADASSRSLRNQPKAVVGGDPAIHLTDDLLAVCDSVLPVDPLSDAVALEYLRQTLEERTSSIRHQRWAIERLVPLSWRLRLSPIYNRLSRSTKMLLLVLAFWRQEELDADLKNDALAHAFETDQQREQYFLDFHLRKAKAEFLRIWMPESGTLGLRFWQTPYYSIGGAIACLVVVLVVPQFSSDDAVHRNTLMNSVLFVYVGLVFALATLSILIIAKKHFVVQERVRLRLSPLTTYYQNVQALIAIGVEIVQLNSLSFDPTIKWNETDQIPKLIQWLGNTGITEFGIHQVQLKAALSFLTLVIWFLLLKCANKFQTNAVVNRVLTKDLPSVLNGMLYMGLISTLFSFLACVDCHGPNRTKFTRCQVDPDQPPFLLNHQTIACWTSAHTGYALLGLAGVTFFVPIGLLAHGMSQVLFQQEILDVKYAPVILLTSQLVKALTSTARAFFLFDPLLLASIALGGNAVLFVLMLSMQSASLWYIKHIKCGLYAASCWSALCAIYRVRSSSTQSMSLVYLGWLSVVALTTATLMLRAWYRAETKWKEQQAEWTDQRALLENLHRTDASVAYSPLEKTLVSRAKTLASSSSRPTKAFLRKATKLQVEKPPEALVKFVNSAKTLASSGRLASGGTAVQHALFMQQARKLARKLERNET